MAIRLSGMISGLDTDALIDELVSAYNKKKDKYVKEQKSLEYKQDAWKGVNTKIYSFYSGKLSGMRFSSGYLSKAASISDKTKATVTASNTAVNGVQTLQIKQLAKTGYLTGAKIESSTGGTIKGQSKLKDLGIGSEISGGRISVTSGGKDSYIDINGDMTMNELVVKFKEAGLNASYDEINGRFFVSSKTSGIKGDFSLAGNDGAGSAILKKLGLYTISAADIKSYGAYIDAVNADTEYITNSAKNEYLNGLLDDRVAEINANTAQMKKDSEQWVKEMSFASLNDAKKQEQLDALSKSITQLEEWLNSDAVNTISEDERKRKEESLQSMNDTKALYENVQATVGSSDDSDFQDRVKAFRDAKDQDVKANDAAIKANNEQAANIQKIKSGDIAGKEQYLDEQSIGYDYSETGDGSYANILTKYNDRLEYAKEITDKYNEYQTKLENVKNGTGTPEDIAAIAAYEEEFGLKASDTGAVRIEGSDSLIYLNGAKFESNTNSLNINGLTITATSVTAEGEVVTITTSDDIEAMYKNVKNFFTEYNALIKEMDSWLNAEPAGKYEPLTEEEEGELSDKQVEKWEEKVRSASLRGDGTLRNVVGAIKSAMSSSIKIGEQSFSLASFGIKTLGYFASGENEKGMYHIDGDKEDAAVSAKEDKLREALANDPEQFMSFFTQLSQKVYKTLSDKMEASTISSAYTVYNDKSMKKQYKEYDKTIKDWEDKIETMTEKYVQQFAAMEKALASMQSSQSQLSQMLGGK